jgi:SpoVK/Ycf46/Vps4 family AAA+-type ATPase
VILVGLPGCGKSLLAKICSGRFGMPLIRFDLARVFAGLVGQSEQNMRTALNFIDSVGNCVVWMDELEKALSGAGGGGDTSTSGVGSRVFGTFLTWMQEKTSPSFVVATVNNIEGLPPELLRKGRFDEIFYVGLPDEQEREEIFKIHIEKRGRKVKDFDLKELVADSDKFSGAEIEEAIISGMFKAFSLNKEVSHDHVHAAVLQTTPLAESRAADIERMAHWAKMNALCASESLEKQIKGEDRARKLSKR